jgi:N-acylneuraminate cytidylyltransferase/CMP-N,N'-diacetyllegionaminic acid synthase
VYKDKTVLAVIPARSGSKGLVSKNLRVLRGKKLVGWPIEAAIKSGICDKIICSTDSEEVSSIAISYGAEVPFIRPHHLSKDESPTSDALLHAIEFFEKLNEQFDYILLLEPTSPMTTSEDIISGLDLLISNSENSDSLVSVTPNLSGHPDFTFKIDFENNHLVKDEIDKWSPKRRQDVENLYCLDGSIYISNIETFKNRKSFVHERTIGMEFPKWKSYEVDDELDLIVIEAIMLNRNFDAK